MVSSLRVKGMRGAIPSPALDAPHKTMVGGADWAAITLFGSTEKCVEVIEAVARGSQDERWLRGMAIWREWQRRWALGQLNREPTLNCLCIAMKVPVEGFLELLRTSIVGVWGKLATLKAGMAAPQVVEAAVRASEDVENGFKDRQMLLEIAGVVGQRGGLQVNVSQNVGVAVSAGERERRLTPLLQFSETIEELDEGIRGEMSQRALGPAQISEVVEAEIMEEMSELGMNHVLKENS